MEDVRQLVLEHRVGEGLLLQVHVAEPGLGDERLPRAHQAPLLLRRGLLPQPCRVREYVLCEGQHAFHVDDVDSNWAPRRAVPGLTEHVLHQGEPLLLTRADMLALAASGDGLEVVVVNPTRVYGPGKLDDDLRARVRPVDAVEDVPLAHLAVVLVDAGAHQFAPPVHPAVAGLQHVEDLAGDRPAQVGSEAGGDGRIAAVEVLLNTRHIAELIEKGDINEIKEAMEKSMAPGSQTFEQALFKLFMDGKITQDEAMANADSGPASTHCTWNCGRAK